VRRELLGEPSGLGRKELALHPLRALERAEERREQSPGRVGTRGREHALG